MCVCVYIYIYMYISVGGFNLLHILLINLTHCTLSRLQNPISQTAYSDPAICTYRKKRKGTYRIGEF